MLVLFLDMLYTEKNGYKFQYHSYEKDSIDLVFTGTIIPIST